MKIFSKMPLPKFQQSVQILTDKELELIKVPLLLHFILLS